jgi:MFS transporter, Spinster family, sphingosine-1-phosphate transporter
MIVRQGESIMPQRDNERTGEGAWGLLALLAFLNVLNFVDRQLLASFANFIKPDLGLTDTQFGLLNGAIFLLFYAFAGLFMGVLADRTHRGKLIAAASGLWSLLTAASGAAVGFVSMAIPRALIGVGESALAPTAISFMADRFPAHRLGMAAGIYYMGVPIGAGASLLIAGFLGPAIGWRNCFYILGGIGLLIALAMLLVRDDRVVEPYQGGPAFTEQMRLLWSILRRTPALCATIFGGVALHFSVGAASFDQLWFVQERGFERAEIAKIAGLFIVVAGIAGNLVGGLVGDWWQKNTASGRPMLLFWILLLLTPLNILYRTMPADSIFIYIGLGVGIFQLACYYGPSSATIQELAPPGARATVMAFFVLCVNVVGLGIGVTGAGIMADMLRANGSTAPYSETLLAFTVLSALALPAFFLAGRLFKRDKERMAAVG